MCVCVCICFIHLYACACACVYSLYIYVHVHVHVHGVCVCVCIHAQYTWVAVSEIFNKYSTITDTEYRIFLLYMRYCRRTLEEYTSIYVCICICICICTCICICYIYTYTHTHTHTHTQTHTHTSTHTRTHIHIHTHTHTHTHAHTQGKEQPRTTPATDTRQSLWMFFACTFLVAARISARRKCLHTTACQHMSAYVSTRQHTSAYRASLSGGVESRFVVTVNTVPWRVFHWKGLPGFLERVLWI